MRYPSPRALTLPAAVCALVLFSVAAMGQAVDGCQSESSCFFGSVLGCPAGDGTTLASSGGTIYITARSSNGSPYPLVPAADFWLIGCNGGLTLCGSAASSTADSVTNLAGETTMSGVLRVGGCDTALNVVVQGNQLFELPSCSQPQCHPIEVRSVDIDGDLDVNIVDFSIFAQGFVMAVPPTCIDFNFDGAVGIQDFSIFGQHYEHSCQ